MIVAGIDTVALVLMGMRLTGLVMVAPLFSSRSVSVRVRSAVVVLLTLALVPPGPIGAELNVATFVGEWMVGAILGFGAMIFIQAAESAGDILAMQMGLSGGAVLSPNAGTQVPVLSHFLSLFTLALLLAAGGHLIMLEALDASLEALPLGAPLRLADGAMGVVELGSYLFVLGLRIAAPVVGAVLVGNVVLGILARTVPQMNVLMMAFPVQIGLGLVALGISLPGVSMLFTDWGGTYTDLASSILERMAPGVGGGG
jgi:flagellar biosynthetic protein FliR